MKQNILHHILAAVLLLTTGASGLRAQSVEPFSPYGIFSPSVESYQMTRCGNLLPSLYTGAMTFSLPLMTYSDPDFTIPVTLEYSFDGYKPGQHSGSVGYGWYLDCGGVITREVRGIPDEGDGNPEGLHVCRVHGWREAGSFRDSIGVYTVNIFSIQKRQWNDIPVSLCNGMLESYDPFSDTPMYASRTSQEDDYELYDTAPDIYHFRFLGHSGDFMMLPDGTVRVYNSDIPHGELSVEFTDSIVLPESTVITLTTADGYKYVFGCTDVSVTPDCHEESPVHSSKSVSSYHLTRIMAPNDRSVTFSYSGQQNPVVTPSYRAHLNGFCTSRSNAVPDYDNVFSTDNDAFRWTFVREGTHLLDKVTIDKVDGVSAADSIVFRYSAPSDNENARLYFERADESCFDTSPDPAKQLISVSMYGQDGLADSATLTYENAPHGTPKRFLKSVSGMKSGGYTFSYHHPGLVLPPNDTQNTDHWGYWNGSSISDLREHLVEVAGEVHVGDGTGGVVLEGHSDSTYVITLPDTTIIRRCAADLYDQMTDDVKEANPVYALCGALTRIQYPHGGTTEIGYEPNCVTRRMNVRATQTLRHLEPVDSLDAAATWTVGGVRVRSLVDTDRRGHSDTTLFSYTDPEANGRESGILMTMPKYAEAAQYTHWAHHKDMFSYFNAVAYVNAIGFNSCCGFTLNRDPHVVYPLVTIIHPDGATTEHRFTSVSDQGMDDYYALPYQTDKHVYCYLDWFEDFTRYPTCMIPPSIDKKNMRGKPKHTVVRDADGHELKRTEYDYTWDLVTIPHLGFNNILSFSVASYQVVNPVLISTVETERGVTVRTDRSCNSLGQKKLERTASAGDTLEVRYRYIHETAGSSPSGYDRLLCDAVRTRRAGGKTYLLAAENYDYGDWKNPFPTRITSRIIPEEIDVTGLTDAALFTTAQSLQGKIMDFEYRDNSHPHHLTRANFPGGAYISYAWNKNHICSKIENGAPNETLYTWNDLIGLTGLTSPSGQIESYRYDAHNRPYKTLDAQNHIQAVIHYNLKHE